MKPGVYKMWLNGCLFTTLIYPIRGGKAKAVFIDGSVKTRVLSSTELAGLMPVEFHGRPYPIKRAVRQYKTAGRNLGISKAAVAVLKRAASNASETAQRALIGIVFTAGLALALHAENAVVCSMHSPAPAAYECASR